MGLTVGCPVGEWAVGVKVGWTVGSDVGRALG